MTEHDFEKYPIQHVAGTYTFKICPAYISDELLADINAWYKERGVRRGKHFDVIDQANNVSYWGWCYVLAWRNPEDALEFKLRFL